MGENAKFRIESGAGTDGTMHLRIIDAPSGMLLAGVRLDAEETLRLLRGGSVYIDGEQAPHLERVGLRMVNESYLMPRQLDQGYVREERLTAGENWARAQFPGWDSYEPRLTNAGVQVIVRRWEK